jgi:hypothetical protein
MPSGQLLISSLTSRVALGQSPKLVSQIRTKTLIKRQDGGDQPHLAGKFQVSWFQTPLHEFILQHCQLFSIAAGFQGVSATLQVF